MTAQWPIKPTPGPWEAGLRPIVNVVNGDLQHVADVFPADDTDERDANAWLIAAAPDLLEALQAMVTPTDDVVFLHWSDVVEKAKAAIEKAHGSGWDKEPS